MARHQPEAFARHMPKSALMSNWYYQRTFDTSKITGSPAYIEWCLKNLARERFKGLQVSPWFGTGPRGNPGFFAACDQMAEAKRLYARLTGGVRA